MNDFVRTKDNTFVLSTVDKPLRFIGGNSYHLLKYAVNLQDRPLVIRLLDFYANNNFTVLRTWAFWDGDESQALQTGPGVYNEKTFCALDFILHEASLRGVRLYLVLTNYWPEFGGMQQYLRWSKGAGQWQPEMFYEDPVAFDLYVQFIREVLNRRNSISGVKYKDDPVIFAWSIVNEPRYMRDTSGKPLYDWLCAVGSIVKEEDSNHMVTFDSEGFLGESMPSLKKWNPYDTTDHGVDFLWHSSISYFDFCCFHLWPDNWGLPSEEDKIRFSLQWILTAHCTPFSEKLNKPLVLSEFGKSKDQRLHYFSQVLPETERQIMRDQLCGVLVWHVATPEYPDYDNNTIYVPVEESDSQSDVLCLLTTSARRSVKCECV